MPKTASVVAIEGSHCAGTCHGEIGRGGGEGKVHVLEGESDDDSERVDDWEDLSEADSKTWLPEHRDLRTSLVAGRRIHGTKEKEGGSKRVSKWRKKQSARCLATG